MKRQRSLARLRAVRAVLAAGLVACGASGVSCSSVYDKATAMLPADGGERAALRMRDARKAGEEARAAARTLDASLASGDAARGAIDADRVQVRAWEVRRRVLSARDAGGIADPGMNEELGGLERLAADLSRAVTQAREGRRAEARRTLVESGAVAAR